MRAFLLFYLLILIQLGQSKEFYQAAQTTEDVNAEAVFLRSRTFSSQDLVMYGSINSDKPTNSMQKLGTSIVSSKREFGLATFDYDSDGRDDIVTYGWEDDANSEEARVNKIKIYDVIGDHSFNNNFSKTIDLKQSSFSSLNSNNYDINGITTGDFDGDGNKDDIALIARKISDQDYHYRFRILITLLYDAESEEFKLGDEYEFTESGYSFLGITSGKFREAGSSTNVDDIAVIRSKGDSNPSLINNILIFPVLNTKTISSPYRLSPLNYDIRNIDTNENFNDYPDAHKLFRPNTIKGGNFYGSDNFDEIALIVRDKTSANVDDYYKILVIGDFDFSTNVNAGYNTRTVKSLPGGFHKALHAITSEDFNDDGIEDLLVYGSNGYGIGERMNTNVNAKMFLYTSEGTQSGVLLKHRKTIAYNASLVLAVTAGRFSRPEYATMEEDDGTLYFPLWWYHQIIGNHATNTVKQKYLNDFKDFVDEGIMNGANLYASSNWLKSTDNNITQYLNNAENFKINLATQIIHAYRYLNIDYWDEFDDPHYLTQYDDLYIKPRVSQFASRSEVWGWYMEDEPHLDFESNGYTYPASYDKLQDTYNTIKSEDNYNKNISVLDNFRGWYDLGYEYYFPNLDVAMWEDYPGSYGSDSNTFSYRAQTSRLIADLAYKALKFNNDVTSMKPIIGVLQAQEGDDIVESDLDDYRYMIYTSLIHGSRGLAFYAYHRANSTIKTNVNNAITQLKNLNIPEIISSEPYKGVSTQFENSYSSGSYSYQNTGPYDSMDRDNNPDTQQYFHQITWINYAFRKQSDGYYLLLTNDSNMSFCSSGCTKDEVKISLPFYVFNLESFKFSNNSWISKDDNMNGKTFSANFTPYEVKYLRINGNGTLPYPGTINSYSDPSITQEVENKEKSKYELELSQNYPNPFNPRTTIPIK